MFCVLWLFCVNVFYRYDRLVRTRTEFINYSSRKKRTTCSGRDGEIMVRT